MARGTTNSLNTYYLAAPITIGDSSCTLTADPGSDMSTTDTFSINIGDTSSTPSSQEVIDCTRSGVTITFVGGTAAKNHAAGDAVNQVISKNDYDNFFKKDYDLDLSAIENLTPSNDDIIQRKTGSWVNRTMAQLWTDLTNTVRTFTGTLVLSNPIRLPAGTNSAPALTWTVELTSGWYRKPANAFGFAIATNDVLTIFSTLINAKVPFYAEKGLVYGELYNDNSMSPYDLEMDEPRFVKIDTTAGAVQVNLPSNVDSFGPQEFTFMDVGQAYGGTGFATNNFTLTPDGSETIDGAASRVLNINRAAITIVPDVNSVDWAVIAER